MVVVGDASGRGGLAGDRPSIAHPCTDWDDDHVKEHLRACQTGRDPITGEWDFDADNEAEVWAWLWETMPRTLPDGSQDWGAWASSHPRSRGAVAPFAFVALALAKLRAPRGDHKSLERKFVNTNLKGTVEL